MSADVSRAGLSQSRCFRPIHRVKFWWETRHWDRRHGPGCPVRYGTGVDCIGLEISHWCRTSRATPPADQAGAVG